MFNTDFAAAVATASNTATAASKAAILAFVEESALHFGFGLETVSGGVVNAGTDITSYVVDFAADGGKVGKLTFTAAAVTFPTGAVEYEGNHDIDGDAPAATLWTATLLLDGEDVDTTADSDERVKTLTKLVGVTPTPTPTPSPTASPEPTPTPSGV